MSSSKRRLLVSGERHLAGPLDSDAELRYGVSAGDAREGTIDVARVPLLERRLRLRALPSVPLLAPFGRRPRAGFRELTAIDPRVSRLWGRFSVDVGVALERDASFFAERVFGEGGHRVFIVEDGDRYALRAMCVWRTHDDRGIEVGDVVELLHDRTVAGLRAASHVLGLALRAMSDAGAALARAWSFTHSGTFPVYARHAFVPRRSPLVLRAGTSDPLLADFVSEPRHWYVSLLDAE